VPGAIAEEISGRGARISGSAPSVALATEVAEATEVSDEELPHNS